MIGELSKTRSGPEVSTCCITAVPDLKYFFDYSGVSFERFCCGLISAENEKRALVVPKLDEAKAEKSAAGQVFAWRDSDGYAASFSKALDYLGVRGSNFGCEDSLTLSFMNSVRKVKPEAQFVSVSDKISRLRAIKDEEEIKAIRKSAKRLALAYDRLPKLLKVGKKESEVGFELRKFLSEEDVSLDFCAVQAGANSAIPHYETGSKKIKKGDLVLVDLSSTDQSGYFADFTRTYSIGAPSKKQRDVYDAVQQGQRDARAVAGPGVPAKTVDAAARETIEGEGYGDQFIHRTGHGLGLDVHELPWITGDSAEKLQEGMVFTIEPGVYLPGKFGVRIEDDVVVTASGIENLTKLDHALIEI